MRFNILTESDFGDGLEGVLTLDAASSTSSACTAALCLALFHITFDNKYITILALCDSAATVTCRVGIILQVRI